MLEKNELSANELVKSDETLKIVKNNLGIVSINKENLKVTYTKDTKTIQINYISPSSEEANRIVTEITKQRKY